MASLRRFVGAVVLIFSAVGTVCCVGGTIAVWVFSPPASDRVQNILTRLDDGLQRASAANQNVRRAVAKARADVAAAGKESADLGKGGAKGRRATRALQALVQNMGPDIHHLRGRLSALSDSAVVISSLVQSFQDLPAGRINRISPEQLEQWGEEAQQLSARLRRLEAAVGSDRKEASEQLVAAAASQVDLVLQRCQATADVWQSQLDDARETVREVQAKTGGWLTLAAVAVTVLCVWVAAGQISLFTHALRWVKGRPRDTRDSRGPVPGPQS
jgi:small-conductance mechanosensitive channel